MKTQARLEITDRDGVVVASFLGKHHLGEAAVAELSAVFARIAGESPAAACRSTPASLACESLHEYPSAAADRPRE
jgi:hypothetical protein